jgi:serine protease Do
VDGRPVAAPLLFYVTSLREPFANGRAAALNGIKVRSRGWDTAMMRYCFFVAMGLSIACTHASFVACAQLVGPRNSESTPADEPKRAPETKSRDEEFSALAADVAIFEMQASLLKRAVKLAAPAVVHIEAKKNLGPSNAASEDGGTEEAGSGVLIEMEAKFFALTNRHVVADAPLSGVLVKAHDGRALTPVRIWSDHESDVAVIELREKDLVSARLGDSGIVEIGDFVVAVGSPFGLSHSITYGIISAKGRRDLELGDDGVHFQDFMQTDAAINPGNSGGPLVNLRGEVIGINTAIASSSGGNEGIGFTIPIKMVMFVAAQLIEKGFVERGHLGVMLDPAFSREKALRAGLKRLEGALITKVTPNSPADKSGLQVGDVILSYNAEPIENDNHLVNMVGNTAVGAEVTLVVFRKDKDSGGKQFDLTLHIAKRAETVKRTSLGSSR